MKPADLSESCRIYGGKAIYGIQNYGNESVAHLCLPTRTWRYLLRGKINTIAQLRDLLHNGELGVGGSNFGERSMRWTTASLIEFDKRIKELEVS